jgi:hypothetical protein
MSADLVTNPVAQTQVSVAYSAPSIIAGGEISKASLQVLMTYPSFSDYVIPLLNQSTKSTEDIEVLNAWAITYFSSGGLTQAEFDFLAAPTAGTTSGAPTGLVNQTVADPSWTSTVPWDIGTLGRSADAFDIEAARPLGGS